jgi:two-component system cell cycle sensor histidine kinase/response regulator CckA
MNTKYGITKTFLYSMVILAFISVGLVGYSRIINEYERFKNEEATLREEYVKTQENLIKNETDKVIDYIEYKKSQAEERLKQLIKNRTEEAYQIALNLYRENKDAMDSFNLEKVIKDALRPIRYNNQSGYYFITRLDGVEILFADRPELENQNLIDLRNFEGKFVIRDMIKIIEKSGEGFYRYTWTKPNEIGKDFPKIAYITHFEPFNWLIGTGQYLDDVVSDIQQEVLARIEKINFGEDGYIFAGRWDGLSLSGPAKGRNMIDITDVNGVEIVRELIKAAKSGGGYVSYVIPKLNSDVTFNKLSYTMEIPGWGWYVGAGVNVEKIETTINQKKAALQKRVKNHFFKITAILVMVLFLILLAAKFISNRMKKSFDLFSAFFSNASTTSAKIDSEKLPFVEFESLAQSANRMIQERNRAETALRESEKNYRELVQSANCIILRMDTKGQIIFFNNYGRKFFGYGEEEIIGKNVVGTIVPPKDSGGFNLEAMIKDICTNPEHYVSNENENVRRNGELVRVTWMNKVIYGTQGRIREILAVGIDVTEKWKLEKRLAQAQKMEAIGTLAGGIAHDFNNILSAIIGYTELSLMDTPKGDPMQYNLEQVLKAGARAKELVQQILTFSRQREDELHPIKVNLIVNEAIKLLRASLPSTIQIRHKIESDLTVLSDATNIHQILMNLCTNSSYAMQENGGILDVNLSDVDLESNFTGQHPGVKPGKFIKLTVSDTGCGMSPEVSRRIFDPFFTTKKIGQGTGMGLSVVHGIVKSHGGAITVDSIPGQGTTFSLFLPATETVSITPEDNVQLMVTGTEHILFVDDEDFQADMGKRLLARLGYRVTARTNSLEALELFRQSPYDIDLVITDMTMPAMTGDVLAAKIISIRPDIPVIVCTGYSERIDKKTLKKIGIKQLAMKPLAMKDLAELIRRVLDEKSERPGKAFKLR